MDGWMDGWMDGTHADTHRHTDTDTATDTYAHEPTSKANHAAASFCLARVPDCSNDND
jgi:hypothetical protein